MNCRELNEFVIDYLEGQLPDDARAAFERQLTACVGCRTWLDTYRRCIAMGRTACECVEKEQSGPMPEHLVEAILAARRRV